MKRSRILLALGVAAVAVMLAAPISQAQCPVSQEFGAQGNPMITGRIIIDNTTNGYAGATAASEFGSVWDTVNGSSNFGAGPHFAGSADNCPSSVWYLQNTFTGVNSGIQGFIGGGNCFDIDCPATNARVTTLVEDQTPGGTNAGFILYSVDSTFAAQRPWDHARTAGIAQVPSGVATQRLEHYPRVHVVSSSGPPPGTTLTNNYVDLALNFHGADLTAQASTGILSYDIVAHQGSSAPGRLRSGYSLGTIASIPYANSGVTGHMLAVPCGGPTSDTYLAVGATFKDGNGSFPSMLVGQAIAVECDPNIANPQQPMIERAPQRSRKQMGQLGR